MLADDFPGPASPPLVLDGPADLYIAPLPRCPVHGQMSVVTDFFRGVAGKSGYVCRGYDGEGCYAGPVSVAADEQPWTLIGRSDG